MSVTRNLLRVDKIDMAISTCRCTPNLAQDKAVGLLSREVSLWTSRVLDAKPRQMEENQIDTVLEYINNTRANETQPTFS